jgi:hypothetical protein
MTPQEQALVNELLDRLAKLESSPRDRDAERLIADGMRQAPHAVYERHYLLCHSFKMVLHHGLQFFQRRAVLKILWAFGSPASFIALGRACRYGATSAARAAAGGSIARQKALHCGPSGWGE